MSSSVNRQACFLNFANSLLTFSLSVSCRLQALRIIDTSSILKECSLKHHSNIAQQRPTFHQRSSRAIYLSSNAAAGHPLDSEHGAYDHNNTSGSIKHAVDAFYRFSRPHTIIGTVKCQRVVFEDFISSVICYV